MSSAQRWLPRSIECLRGYTVRQFSQDLVAGLTVGLVALPLAMAFAIASGVTPQAGLYTAVVAGFLISALGGSRTQIGGPTGAFVVIVAGIVVKFGVSGLALVGHHGGRSAVDHGLHRPGRGRQIHSTAGYDRIHQRHSAADRFHPDQRLLWHENAARSQRISGSDQDAHSLRRNHTVANRSGGGSVTRHHLSFGRG